MESDVFSSLDRPAGELMYWNDLVKQLLHLQKQSDTFSGPAVAIAGGLIGLFRCP
jgi:hypothetical protein